MTTGPMRVLLLLVLLAGCGALPQPFYGNPGRDGLRLSQPPPSRLAIPTPSASLLTDGASATWADATAQALSDRTVPASHAEAQPGDWTLSLSASLTGQTVVPTYVVLDSRGGERGRVQGASVPAAAWQQADRSTLQHAADEAAPEIEGLLTRIEAATLQSDPNSLLNRPARVYLSGVTGAPGDGNSSLAEQMRRKLAALGIVVQDTADGADYALHGAVKTDPAPQGQLRIELAWTVDDARGERGKVTQLNEVPQDSVAKYWGDVAVVAAEQAAGGIKEVLDNAAGPRPQPADAVSKQ